jgi:hypothetical protein
MRQLVYEQELRLARKCGIEIKFGATAYAVCIYQQRQVFKAGQEAFGFCTSVRLDIADNHVRSGDFTPPRILQHGKGLADTGIGAKENLEFAALRTRFLRLHFS